MRIRILRALALIPLLFWASPSLAQDGATLTPDALSYLVSKDILGARWTIALNVSPDDGRSIVSLTGNILKADGQVLFVDCFARRVSPQFTGNPAQPLTFDCKSMGPCGDDALACSRGGWQPLTDDKGFSPCGIFFLPGPGGSCPARQGASAVGFEETAAPNPESMVVELAEAVAAQEVRAAENEPAADADPRSRTLTADGLNHLVTFNLFGARWSVSLNFFPTYTDAGVLEKRLESMTGNLFFADGRAPKFVHCVVRSDSGGTLVRPESTFRFDCEEAPPCQSDSLTCAEADWSPLASDVQLAASTFLPPGGLGMEGSDDGLIVLPPAGSVASFPGFTVPFDQTTGSASARRSSAERSGSIAEARVGTAAACPSQTCSVRVGSCPAVQGVASQQGGDCVCTVGVGSTPPECIQCGGGATGSPGGACSLPIGRTIIARGLCLPFSSKTSATTCYIASTGGDVGVSRCGGPTGEACGVGGCCADDPSDGCQATDQSNTCVGVCVDSGGCDATVEQCGICLPPTAPLPVVTLMADPDQVAPGGSSVLTWSSENATLCEATRGWSGPRSPSGTEVVNPTETTEYVLTCFGPGGSSEAAAIVDVADAQSP
jgi:hypothetical protein